ncbi:MAG: hypothetical protein A2511_03105 [Deltaproteobacteria bacterium RIFOXYD12_FULL_50_9]|nr:MAG: hypothetical protein A2511_03105 [Deltaproteobacteria bacterium RIFOXYD12_FULL_50_9]
MNNPSQNPTTSGNNSNFNPTEMIDTISSQNLALRAFGALLSSSDLTDFVGDRYRGCGNLEYERRADNLRNGLSQIIELYLDKQEQTINSYVEQCQESDYGLMREAYRLIGMVEAGAFRPQDAGNKIREALNCLGTIAARGNDLFDRAEAMIAALEPQNRVRAVRMARHAKPEESKP